MKKHWQRGVLLGVSMALLLAAGVALANGPYITAEQGCFECWESPEEVRANPTGPPEDKVVEFTIGGWDPQSLEVCWIVFDAVGQEPWDAVCISPVSLLGDPCHIGLWVECDGLLGYWSFGADCYAQNLGGTPVDGEVALVNGIPSHYGGWTAEIVQTLPNAMHEVGFVFAEQCPEEFVPERGTIVLLGGGLVGLAGYATLRWRARN